MAKKVDNEKGFLVIEVSAAELSAKAGGYGICDYCNTPAEKGYYIAVLNQWYCPKCYDEFCKRAKYYQEDTGTEKRNYELYSKLFVVHRSFDLRQFYSCFNYQCFILVFKDIAITETITS